MHASASVGGNAGAARAAAMISGALSRRSQELAKQGSAFVVATVVRVERPTSVEPGNAALVLGDGTIEGFVGGVCAQHSVRLYALEAIGTGQALLLRILPEGGFSETREPAEEDPAMTREVASEDGTVTVQNPCLSGGAIELFLEPVLPAPRVVLAGDSPIVAALARIGPELGLAVVEGDAPSPGDLGLVVAAHGRDEVGILRTALEADVPYVGLVASRKRGAAVLDQLREAGVAAERLASVDTPAGLDIGARTAAEIAVSILARIIEIRRHQGAAAAPTTPSVRPNTAVDPICGMTVVVGADTPSLEHASGTIYFCCMGCKLKYQERHGHAAIAG
jgi:xanthine dehydrogenase accessory factor